MEGTTERSIYINQREGRFERLAIPEDDLSKLITRTTEAGNKYDVFIFDYVEAYITRYAKVVRTFNNKDVPTLQVYLHMPGEIQRVLQVHWRSKSATDILQRMESIDYTQPVWIKSGLDRDTERGFIYMKQGAKNVPMLYTVSEPGDRPQWEQKMINGETVWDRTEEFKWWETKIILVNAQIAKVRRELDIDSLPASIQTLSSEYEEDDIIF